MTRCQHCSKLTHSEHLNVEFYSEDIDKIQELATLKEWSNPYEYVIEDPRDFGKLKCGDIYIHFLMKSKTEK